MTSFVFDDRNIVWSKLADLEHFVYSILGIDQNQRVIDLLIKFDAHQQIVLHRHKVHNNMFVIQGEHRLYEADGTIKEIRPVGRFTSSPPQEEPHREGGGDQDAIVLFSIHAGDEILYEVLDDNLKVATTLSFQDFVGLYSAQQGKAS